jgi:aminoglycoside phosphotransferase (APT) family kinase protein
MADGGSTDELSGVDLASLREYFAAHVPGATGAPLDAELIAGGRSNLTYGISDGTHEWVLRRPPMGHVLPTAHDMQREYRVLHGLAGTGVPVPTVHAFCDDPTVNGAPFYVMERVRGDVLRDGAALAALDPDAARACSEQLVDVLARIHSVDYERVGLADFGRPEGFLERQLRRWSEQWERSKGADLPALDELARRLRAALPESGPPAIVHGDYRLDNVMLASGDPGRIVAVLDWEMSTLGDPLADLGLFLLYWGSPDAQNVATGQPIGTRPGFLSRDEVVDRYARAARRDVDQLDWYLVFAAFKLAVIVEGINARIRLGKTLGEGFTESNALVAGLVESALAEANGSSIAALRS